MNTQNSIDWPMGGGNERRTGVAHSKIKPPLKILWCSKEIDYPQGGIAVSGTTAVCWDNSQGPLNTVIYGIDIQDGRKLWTYSIAGLTFGTPAIKDEYVYGGSSSLAFCLDLNTGNEVWKTDNQTLTDNNPLRLAKDIPVATVGCPLCIKEFVIFCDKRLVIFDIHTGETVLDLDNAIGEYDNVGPCSDGNYLYCPSRRKIFRFKLQSNMEENYINTFGKVSAGPVIADSVVLYGSSNSTIEAIDQKSFKPAWSFKIEDQVLYEDADEHIKSRPAYSRGKIFFGGTDGNVYALDTKKGTRLWKHQTGAPVTTSPVISDNIVYISNQRGVLCAFNTDDGRLLWSHDLEETLCSPAIARNILFAGGDHLYAFVPVDE
ncbi:PQQ-binding-like beta-propeller repeat protein [Candidatus Latescibacterota bacterium]